MDLLKQEVLKRRKALSEEVGGRRIFNRAELEKKRLQKLREEERLELAAKHAASAKTPSPSVPITQSTPVTSSSSSQKPTPTPEEARIDEMNLPKPEVIRRLRFLKQPITLFGEDDAARLERLKHVLKAGTFEVDSDMTEGQTNDFLRDIAELKKGKAKKRAREDMEEGEREGGEEEEMGGEGGGDSDEEETNRMMRGNLEDLCGEDKILVFFKRLLNEWKEEFNEMGVLQRMTAKEKKLIATFQQCERYLKPLFKFCKKKVLPDDIRQALLVVVECCLKRDYLAAMDQYIKLSIGNAPWPIGVTMVGIHERSAREKIHTNSVAHIMNDETTRKYLQSIKRLMTFCQRRYPTMPSKAVEFNSLANGSDLQSLLAEEKNFGGTRPSEERLRLMPAVKDS